MKKNIFYWVLPLSIIILAIFLRFYQLGNIPIEINRDEASLGYTAYSILQTGTDEHGLKWPINIESFGDWKLPVYVYTLIPSVKIFGLTSWAVKLPSALAGVGIVVLSGIVSWILTFHWKDLKKRYLLSLLVSLMIAISPWNIHMSHMAYEANLAMMIMLAGVILLLIALENKSKQFLLIPSAILFGLTFFTYHSYQIFTPLLVLAILFIYQKQTTSILNKNKTVTFTSIFIAGLFTLTLLFTSFSANKTKFSGLSIFDTKSYAPYMEINRGYFENRNSLLAKLHSNNISFIANQAQRNIADIFSSKFLFFEGGTHGSHDIPGTGKMYSVAFIFIMISLYQFLVSWQKKELNNFQKVILAWIGISVIAPFITFEAAHTIRFSPALFGLEFLSAYGLFILLTKLSKNIFVKLLSAFFIFILAYSVIYFLATYFVISPKRDIDNQNWQISRIVELVNDRYEDYDNISMPGAQWSPYIYFLYLNKTDPKLLGSMIEYLPVDNEGFKHVKRLGKIDFTDVDWNNNDDNSTLFVIKKAEIPGDKLESNSYEIEYSLTNPYAKDEWILLSKNK
ncbi:MAG: hypothetical protein GW941_01000 [Candidatus Pacebacteria bacterium]|nr:hypothetical protein [Candidatus Paceibacterota bacterium]